MTPKPKFDCDVHGAEIRGAAASMKLKYTDHTFTTSVAFTESPSVDILLGQEDFFECFRIKFEKEHDIFDPN